MQSRPISRQELLSTGREGQLLPSPSVGSVASAASSSSAGGAIARLQVQSPPAPPSTYSSRSSSSPGRPRPSPTPTLQVTVELEARGQLLADLSTLLAELQLDVVGADIATAGAVARDSFAVRYCGALTPAELEAALRERLRQQLQVRRLLPGDAVLPANLRGGGDDGGDDGGDGDGGSGGAAPPTWLALFDLRAFSHALVVHGGAIGETWSRLLQTRAPQLWKHLIAHDTGPAPERRPGGAPAPPAPVVMRR